MSLAALLAKDLLREGRGREGVQAALVVALLFALAFLFALGPLRDDPQAGAAVLWLPMLFGGIAACGRAMQTESDQGSLDLLRMAPVAWGLHGASRTVVGALVVAAVAAAAAAAGAWVWGAGVTTSTLVVLAVCVPGIAIVASLAGALAAPARQRDMLLSLLSVPALAPLLQAGIHATMATLGGASVGEVRPALLLVLGYDVAALGVAWLLWPVVMEAD